MRKVKILLGWVAVALALGALVWIRHARREHRFDAEITSAAAKHGVDKFLLKALVWQESRFDPNARSPAGALGLTQMMPSTGKDWAKAAKRGGFHETELLQPLTSLDAGAWYLARAQRFWANRGTEATTMALAEYNAGRANVLKWINDTQTAGQPFVERIQFGETKRYVTAVLEKMETYRARGKL